MLFVCLFVCLSFCFFFRTNENCTILGINKNTSPKIIRPRTRKYTSLTVWVCFFPHKWKLCNIGDKNISPKIIRPRTKKYTSFTVLVKYRRGGWKITTQEKNRALKLLAQLGINPLIQLKKCSLLQIIRDSPSTFYKRNHFWFNKRYTIKIYPEQKTCSRNDIDFILEIWTRIPQIIEASLNIERYIPF